MMSDIEWLREVRKNPPSDESCQRLWKAVLIQTWQDRFNPISGSSNRNVSAIINDAEESRGLFFPDSVRDEQDFTDICDYAGVPVTKVRRNARKESFKLGRSMDLAAPILWDFFGHWFDGEGKRAA